MTLPSNEILFEGSQYDATETDATETNAVKSANFSGLAGAAAGIFNTAVTALNPKYRDNQLAIAEANAREAEANATTQTSQSFDPKYIIGAVLVIVLIIVILMKAKSK